MEAIPAPPVKLSEADKSKLRAERFGLPVAEGAKDKPAASSSVGSLGKAETQEEMERRKKRAERFGMPVPMTKEEVRGRARAWARARQTCKGDHAMQGSPRDAASMLCRSGQRRSSVLPSLDCRPQCSKRRRRPSVRVGRIVSAQEMPWEVRMNRKWRAVLSLARGSTLRILLEPFSARSKPWSFN